MLYSRNFRGRRSSIINRILTRWMIHGGSSRFTQLIIIPIFEHSWEKIGRKWRGLAYLVSCVPVAGVLLLDDVDCKMMFCMFIDPQCSVALFTSCSGLLPDWRNSGQEYYRYELYPLRFSNFMHSTLLILVEYTDT